MTLNDEQRLDRALAVAQECREVISEMYSAQKALRQTIKEANETADRLIAEKVDEAVAKQLQISLNTAVAGFKKLEEKVASEINKLADTFLKGPKNMRGEQLTLQELAERRIQHGSH